MDLALMSLFVIWREYLVTVLKYCIYLLKFALIQSTERKKLMFVFSSRITVVSQSTKLKPGERENVNALTGDVH